ncbi:DUF2577 domain-containing protein [Paenibacillus sp. ACRRX]|uniref:DUF2577 family protein n=1 Tax=Paenibacillus sp. ACRRX TaxID=2918206 RepID=UPI001EF605B8|nr:DUF2577 family protein [Paenibacillus sp. ACRRX]MCG7410129.1 DUF2577 domain-containing protein [Paenibacillus sp. ACRRX]
MSQWSWFVDYIREQGAKYNPPYMMVGEVLEPSPKLQIRVEGIVLGTEDLWVAESLLDRNIPTGAQVAIMPMQDSQRFIVLGKVVRP